MALRTALIGYGLGGSVFHAPLIAATDGLELTTVVTRDRGRAAAARDSHPGVRVEATPGAVFERAEEHDLVIVASRNDTHAELAAAAIDAGLAVVVDKPLAPGAEAAAELVERADRAGVPLTVFHNRRWDSDQLTLRRLIEAGELGEVLRYESRFERWRPQLREEKWRETTPPERGGGLLLDLGTHLVDQALTLFGPARSVSGDVEHRRGGPADDDSFIALEHTSGVRSHLWVSDLVAARGPRLRVLGTRAGYIVDELDGQEDALLAGARPGEAEPWGAEPPSRWGRLSRGDAHSETIPSERGDWPHFYAQLAAALNEGGPLPVDPRDAVAVLEILERVRRD